MFDAIDFPFAIYERAEGDELLDAHNDIIATFEPTTEPKVKRLVTAAPELVEAVQDLLYHARGTTTYQAYRGPDETWDEAIEAHEDVENAEALLRRIYGEEE